MANAKVAMSSILETVAATANSVSSLINTTTKGVGMLDALVSKVSTEQKLRYKAEADMFVLGLVRESAERQALADIKVVEFCDKSPAHKAMYTKHYDRFSKLFAQELGTETPA